MSEEKETAIRENWKRGDHRGAAEQALEGYGPEVLGYLVSTLRSESDASEVFSMLSEDMWKGIEGFAWRCSFRTWLYTLARHAISRYRRSPEQKPGRRKALSQISEVAERVRTRTLPHLRTEIKDRFAVLRASLDIDDQTLLTLRVDRQLSWEEVARVMSEQIEPDAETLKRGSARLRKRFQKVKAELRTRAAEIGLLEAGS